ncbi:hypothetical protein ACF0H5_002491 [Mactra antiquata]
MEYISIIWKISILIYTVLSMVEYVLTQHMPILPMGDHITSPVLDTTLVTEELLEGNTAVLKCIGSNMEKYGISWLKDDMILARDGILLIDDDRYSITKISNTGQEYLKIVNITLEDISPYSCLLDSFPPTYKIFQLDVKALPRIDKSDMIDRYQFVHGETKTLECRVTGHPEPQVKWYFYKASIHQKPETREVKSSNKDLVLKNLSKKDEGIYRCEASNKLGKDMYEIYFQEVYKPRLSTQMKKTVSKLGSMTAIQCEVESSPVPNQIRWQRNNTFLRESPKYQIQLYAESETKQLTVLNIANTQLSDSGMYICIAANDLGRDNIQLYVIVEDPPSTTVKQVTPLHVIEPSTSSKPMSEVTDESTIVTETDNFIKTTELPAQIEGETPKTEASLSNGAQHTGHCLAILCTIILMKYQVL